MALYDDGGVQFAQQQLDEARKEELKKQKNKKSLLRIYKL